ncbi:hypothetical protein TPB0596_44200 [Tsukamurella pulmonis]|uniref:hypothetical protein n=1 Tax=Tsukamurella pulmonis TaxID=47312 RepID=UPI001EDFDDD5|nr:hypothetical protein [Tsukamurella pulmonis]BDD84657.1 hypothetical protein TPB0596_44200 [Tsukamurella pulmonis]
MSVPLPHRLLHVWPDVGRRPLVGLDSLTPLTGADLGLSVPLSVRIDAWQALFEADHLGGREGWRTAHAEATYAREAHAILDALVTELPGVVIKYHLWPIAERGYTGGWATGWSPSGAAPLPAGTEVRQFDVAPERWIRLMSDYSSTALWATYGNIGPEQLGLSDALATGLAAWQSLWDREVHWESGWSSDAAQQRYRDEGVRLLPLVAAELPGHIVELIAGGDPVYAGAWVDGWLPTLPDGHYSAYGG